MKSGCAACRPIEEEEIPSYRDFSVKNISKKSCLVHSVVCMSRNLSNFGGLHLIFPRAF